MILILGLIGQDEPNISYVIWEDLNFWIADFLASNDCEYWEIGRKWDYELKYLIW